MKKISGICITVMSFVTVLCAPVSAVTEGTISKALGSLSGDLSSLQGGIKKVAVYGVSADSEGRYNPSRIRGIIEKEITENGKLVLVNRKNTADSIREMELGASGAVSFKTIKEAGKISGVDAFVFAYPAVSGRGDRRITVMVKIVEIATGAVVFVEEYSSEERPFFSLSLGVKFIPAYTSGVNAAFYCDNPSQPDWSVDAPLSYSVLVELMAGVSIAPINSSIIAGVAFMPLNKPTSAIDLPAGSSYVNDTEYEYVMVYGLEAGNSFQFFGGMNFPVSSLFVRNSEVLRGRLMYGYGMLQSGQDTSISLDVDIINPPGSVQTFFEQVTVNYHVIRLGFDVALASSINLVLDFDYIIGGSASTARELNSWYEYEVKSGMVVSVGLSYGIF